MSCPSFEKQLGETDVADCNPRGSVVPTNCDFVVEQPVESVTITVYVPAVKPVTVCVVLAGEKLVQL